MVVNKTLLVASVASVGVAVLSAFTVDAYAPTSPLFAHPRSATTKHNVLNKWVKLNRVFTRKDTGSDPLKMSTSQAASSEMFKRKEPFHLAQDNVEFDNLPTFKERMGIRVFHYLSRVMVQWGALSSWNPLVKLVSFILYQIDILWAGMDKEYYVKRRAMYGPNFISATSVVMSKYDEAAQAKDAIDTTLTTPQKRGLFLGSTVMNPTSLPQDGARQVSPLHNSDPEIQQDRDQDALHHGDLREALMLNVFGNDKLKKVQARAKDATTQKILDDFATKAQGLQDKESLSPIVEDFLIQYYHYVLFALPADDLPLELLHDTFFKGLNYILYLFGPRWLFAGLLRPIVKPKKLRKKLELVREYYAESPVLQDYVGVPSGEAKALTKDGFIELLKMIIGVAALQGTKALAIASMTQMPKGCAEAAVKNPDLLRNSVVEVARLDAPVTGAHCIVHENDGLSTKIGKRTLDFPAGTVVFTAMTLANTDEERFDCPYVFDPDRKDMPDKITSFHSIGEQTTPSPRICPGRNVAVDCVCQMMTAKIKAEQK